MHLKKQTLGNIFQNDNRIFMPEVTLLLLLLCFNYSKIKDTQNSPAFSIDNPSHTSSNKAGSTQKSSVKKPTFEEGCAKWRSQKSCCNNSRNPKACKEMETTPTHPEGTHGSLGEGGNQGQRSSSRVGKKVSDAPEVLLETSSFLRWGQRFPTPHLAQL